MDCSTPGLPAFHHLLELAQTHVHWISDAIQPSHPLSSPSPPALSLSQNQSLFQWVDSSHGWPKYWSFSFSISPSSEYSGLISFTIGWLDLLAVQETLLSVFTTIRRHQFFGAKPSLWSNSHIHTCLVKKTIALTIQTFVGKVISLLFNTLPRFVIAFLPMSKCLLIYGYSHHLHWFWSPIKLEFSRQEYWSE